MPALKIRTIRDFVDPSPEERRADCFQNSATGREVIGGCESCRPAADAEIRFEVILDTLTGNDLR